MNYVEKMYWEVCGEVCGVLSAEYGIPKKELLEVLRGGERKKVVPLPWCGVVKKGKCICLRLNHGLYTQCENIMGESEMCKTCEMQTKKNGDKSVYGTVYDRMKVGLMEYKDPKGKMVVPYGNVMEKLKLKKEEVMEASRLEGVEIPSCQFEVRKGKRGRPKKEKKEEVGEKKKRGRPKKETKVVSANQGEDLIAKLVKEQQEKKMEEEAKKKEEENKKKEEEEKKEEEDDEEGTEVVKFEVNGKTYLKSDDDVLYDVESHEVVGVWNPLREEIEEYVDEDEEEED